MKLKKVFLSLCLLATAVCGAVGLSLGAGNVTTASAATYTTPKYLTYGSTSTGSSTSSGCPSNFKIYMHGSSTSGTGTLYQDNLIDWSYVYIKIEPSSISDHLSFKLTRNNYTYASKSLSGNSAITLYSGALSDGEYELEYQGRYRKNIFHSYTTYTYTYRFEVDKTAPSYSLKAGGYTISSGAYTNKQVVYTASDTNFDAIRYLRPSVSSYSTTYSTSYTVAATDANNGWWYMYARDDLGTTNSTVSFYMDTIKPVGKVTSNGSTIANGGYTSNPFYYTATDTGGVSYLQYKTPNSSSWTSYTSGTTLSGTNGWYTFRAVDKAGNISDEYKVCYDTSIATATLYSGDTSVSSGYYSKANSVKFVVSDSISGIKAAYVKHPGNSYYSSYTSGNQLTAEGTYMFYAVNNANLSTAYYTITLDRTKAYGTLYADNNIVSSGTYTNASSVRFYSYDSVSGVAATYVMKPNTTNYVSYTSGTTLTDAGEYKFYCVDRCGNQSEIYIVTIDRNAPSAQLYVDDKPISNNGYTNGEHIRFETADDNLQGCYVKLPDSEEFIDYASGTEFYKAGKYVFFAIDESGLSTGEYSIVIDRENKPLTFNNVVDGITNGNVTITWTDGDANTSAPITSVTINGVPYAKGSIVNTIDTGVYEVVCTDAAGNVWKDSFSSTAINITTKTLQKEFWEVNDADGNFYSFENYDNAFAFACLREKGFVRTGTWNNDAWDTGLPMDEKDAVNAVNGTYFIYKKSGDAETEVAYFTEERLNEVIAEYAAVGIECFYYWQKAPATYGANENLFRYSDAKTILANYVSFVEGVNFTVNGEPVNGLVFETEGVHELIVSDAYGNECAYTLIVVREAPAIEYALGEGGKNTVVFDREYYFSDVVTVSISDELDEMAMFRVFDENGELLAYCNREDTFTLNQSGKYVVQAVNHAGQSEEFVLFISLDEPKITGEEDKDAKRLIIDVTDSVDKYSILQTLTIEKSVDGGETWEILTSDDYGTPVSLENLTYQFRTTGEYRITLTDAFRTGIDSVTAQFSYLQPAPAGILEGVENNGYTNANVQFTWSDEALVTLKKDGGVIEYYSGKVLTENGEYELVFENHDGYKETFNFVIDKTPVAATLNGCEDGDAVNTDVSVSVSETDVKVELYKNGELVGDYESDTVLTDDANYRIVVTDKANNVTEVDFTIDKTVDFESSVIDNVLANETTFKANEELNILLTKDGDSVAYDFNDVISESGKYTAIISDTLGNTVTVNFTIVEPIAQSFFHNFDNLVGFEKVVVNEVDTRLNYGDLSISESGVYNVSVYVNGQAYPFTLTIDSSAPTAMLGGVENGGQTKGSVTVSDLSETATVEVFLNDEPIEYELGDELTEVGKYRVVITDEIGNATEYTFEILYSLNATAIILIIIGILLVAGTVTTVIVMRKKGKFGKKKS